MNLDLDEKRYPEFKKLISDMNKEGIEVMGYINPFLSEIDSLEKSRTDFYEEFKTNGYLVKRGRKPLLYGQWSPLAALL